MCLLPPLYLPFLSGHLHHLIPPHLEHNQPCLPYLRVDLNFQHNIKLYHLDVVIQNFVDQQQQQQQIEAINFIFILYLIS